MNYIEFHKQWHHYGCFNIYQIKSWHRGFNRHNLMNWVKKGYLVKLRKEYYAFADFIKVPNFNEYIANKIYKPSYISLQYALSHYGMIPEAVMQVTSVSSLKTMRFKNDFGEYYYQTVKPDLMFGYAPRLMPDGRAIMFATPEKALLDFLYLNPFYESVDDMLDLRLDENYLDEDLNMEQLMDYLSRFKSASLKSKIDTIIKAYEL